MSNVINTSLKEQKYISSPTVSAKSRRKNLAGSVIGSAIGIGGAVAGVYALAKKGNPAVSLKNLAYEEKDVFMIGAGSVLGGLAGGILTDDDKNNVKPKLREASQQFFGSLACPLGLLAVGNHLLEKHNVKGILPKVAVVLGSLFTGMEVGNAVMNKVNNKIFKENIKHDVKPSDYLVHADDLCLTASMVLKDVKSISAVTSKILPATLIMAGTKTGTKKAGEEHHH